MRIFSRHRQRQYAVQTLYASDINRQLYDVNIHAVNNQIDEFYVYKKYFLWIKDKKSLAVDMGKIPYTIMLFLSVHNHYITIDKKWTVLANRSEMGVTNIDKAILRSAIAEMFYNSIEHIDSAVIIEEYIKIARIFSGNNAYKFINKILDILKKDRI